MSQNNLKENKKICVLVLGSTGTGKSSIIKLLTDNENVQIGHSTTSCTKELSFYDQTDYIYCDTQGFQDVDQKDNKQKEDKQIMANTINECKKEKNLEFFKIIWCLGSHDRNDAQIQREAEFINALDKSNIWNSVIILEKRRPFPFMSDSVLAAVKQHDCTVFKEENIDNEHSHYFSVTIIDWIANEKERQCLKKSSDHTAISSNLFQQKLKEKLNALQECQITYRETKCKKCERQFCAIAPPPLCHGESDKYHNDGDRKDEWEYYHPQSAEEQSFGQNFVDGIQDGKKTPAKVGFGLGTIISAGSRWIPKSAVGNAALGIGLGLGLVTACYIFDGVSCAIKNKKVHGCCLLYEGSEGCRRRYKCCQQDCGKFNQKIPLKNKCGKICFSCQKPMSDEICGNAFCIF